MADCPLDIDACLLNREPAASSLAHLLPNSRPICFVLEGSEPRRSGGCSQAGLRDCCICVLLHPGGGCRGRGRERAGCQTGLSSFSSHRDRPGSRGATQGFNLVSAKPSSLLPACPRTVDGWDKLQLSPPFLLHPGACPCRDGGTGTLLSGAGIWERSCSGHSWNYRELIPRSPGWGAGNGRRVPSPVRPFFLPSEGLWCHPGRAALLFTPLLPSGTGLELSRCPCLEHPGASDELIVILASLSP